MERVLIIGATSAVAAEVARLHAARGDRLHLVGRSVEKLAALVTELDVSASQRVTSSQADFSQSESSAAEVTAWLEHLAGLDRVLIAHGELGDQLESERDFSTAARSFQVNFVSAVALLIPLINYLEAQRSGRIGVITSVAGERGRPRNYTYGSAKGALTLYLQGVRSRLYGTGVSVTTIKLGPVDTPMTVGHEKNALFAMPAPVARTLVQAMDKQRGEIFLPWFWRPIIWAVVGMPEAIFQRFRFLSGR